VQNFRTFDRHKKAKQTWKFKKNWESDFVWGYVNWHFVVCHFGVISVFGEMFESPQSLPPPNHKKIIENSVCKRAECETVRPVISFKPMNTKPLVIWMEKSPRELKPESCVTSLLTKMNTLMWLAVGRFRHCSQTLNPILIGWFNNISRFKF